MRGNCIKFSKGIDLKLKHDAATPSKDLNLTHVYFDSHIYITLQLTIATQLTRTIGLIPKKIFKDVYNVG